MPNFSYYLASQAVSGREVNVYLLVHRLDTTGDNTLTDLVTVGPYDVNGRDTYDQLALGIKNNGGSAFDGPFDYWHIYAPHDRGSSFWGPLTPTATFNFSAPQYDGNYSGGATSSEPTTRLSAANQNMHVYQALAQEVIADNDFDMVVLTWMYDDLVLGPIIGAPQYQWGRKITAGSADRLFSNLYFDNWNTYLYWGLHGTTTSLGQTYMYLRKYNQSGTLIWHRRLQSTVTSPSSNQMGTLAGFDTGRIVIPITVAASSTEYKFGLAYYDASGNLEGTSIYYSWDSPAVSGYASPASSVVSSRPSWDRQYFGWHWYNFDFDQAQTNFITANGAFVGTFFFTQTTTPGVYVRGAIETLGSDAGDAIFVCANNDQGFASDSLILIKFDFDGDIVWQRKLTLSGQYESGGAVTSGTTWISQVKIAWRDEEGFSLALTVTLPTEGWGGDPDSPEITAFMSFPSDGSGLTGEYVKLEFDQGFNSSTNPLVSLAYKYEESNLVFSEPVLIEETQVGATSATTNPFTQTNVTSNPTKTDFSVESANGVYR